MHGTSERVPGTSNARAGVDSAGPVGVDVVLEAAECSILVHYHRVALHIQ